jgi:hypothetical protein
MASLATVVKGVIGGDLGFLGVALRTFLDLLTLLPGVMALLAVFHRIGMFLVPELSPLVLIRLIQPGIVNSDNIRLA